MIASLTGFLKQKNPTEVLLDVHGVGYAVHISLSTYEKLGDVDSTITLLTHLHVREDAMQLFGFATEEERQLFKMLLSVSGIGPKLAQSILSGMNASELSSHLRSGNIAALTAIPGIGKKTAERMVVELRDKISKTTSATEFASSDATASAAIRSEALMALMSLGFNQPSAEKAIRAASNEAGATSLSVEELIKRALRHTTAR
ncbi:MAG TPA: Holliday junction branch migration protein RuvA [Bacteroidota bacterium]|nr:Holliday junction branch migration protein RuvA [Bacteroidota bacterium]